MWLTGSAQPGIMTATQSVKPRQTVLMQSGGSASKRSPATNSPICPVRPITHSSKAGNYTTGRRSRYAGLRLRFAAAALSLRNGRERGQTSARKCTSVRAEN